MSDTPPAMTVMLVAAGPYEQIARTMRHLAAQSVAYQLELIFVKPVGPDLDLSTAPLSAFHSYRVLDVHNLRSVAVGYTAVIRAANAPIVAVAKDHAYPEPTWAESHIVAHEDAVEGVGSVMVNANPNTRLSWADFLLMFGPYADPPLHSVDAMPDHNSSYKRATLLAFGPRLEHLVEPEAFLQAELRAKGSHFGTDKRARVHHVNFSQWAPYLRSHYLNARSYADYRSLYWPWWRRTANALRAVLLPLLGLWRVWPHHRRVRAAHPVPPFVQLVPHLLIGASADALGEAMGYLLGPGRARDDLLLYEVNRLSQIAHDEQDTLKR